MNKPIVKVNESYSIVHAGSYIIPIRDAKIEMDFEKYKLRFTFPVAEKEDENEEELYPVKFKVDNEWLNVIVVRGAKTINFGVVKDYSRFFKDEEISAYMSFFISKKADDALLFNINIAHKSAKE